MIRFVDTKVYGWGNPKAFEILGWDDGSETSEPEGVNVPGPVENLEIDIVGDEVHVTWDPPTTGAVTHYRTKANNSCAINTDKPHLCQSEAGILCVRSGK